MNAYAESYNPQIVADSGLVSETLTATKIQLRQPLIDIDSATGEGTLSLQSDFGDMPLGASIFYTTDGSDPGVAGDGGTVTGTLYSGPIPGAASVPINARVHAPFLYRQWFIPSVVSTESPPPPVISIGFTMSVSTSAP